MDNSKAKPMKKIRRNVFQKMGKRLGKLEQSLVISSPKWSSESEYNYDDSSSEYSYGYSENDDSPLDNVSLDSAPDSHESSQKAPDITQNQSHSTQSVAVSNDPHPNHDWSNKSDKEYVKLSDERKATNYDAEMKVLCQELMENKIVKFHHCKDYEKKAALLHIAISFNAPKVVIPVLTYLEKTLSEQLLIDLIKKYPSAIKNYLNLVKGRCDRDSYISTLRHFGKNQNIALIYTREACQASDFHTKLSLLERAENEMSSHSWWCSQIAEYKHLLTRQRELASLGSYLPPGDTIIDRTVLDTYKTLFNKDFRQQELNRRSKRTAVEHSKEFATACHMCPEMILCAKLSVIMKCGLRRHYDDFVHQAMYQSTFSGEYLIAPENFADMVYNWVIYSGEGKETASQYTEKFLRMIQNSNRRVYYAEKFHNYDVAMDTIANKLHDRAQLENLRKRIPQNHPSYDRATALLENAKWRN